MSRNSFAKQILSMLSSRPAIAEVDLCDDFPSESLYAVRRSLKGLAEAGLVETHSSGRQRYMRLTRDGRKKAYSLAFDNETTLLDLSWDGKWRVILLDLPEDRKRERDALRYLLKKAGFVSIKNSVWISPHPLEHLFANIKKDLALSSELMIFVTDTLDAATEKEFFDAVR